MPRGNLAQSVLAVAVALLQLTATHCAAQEARQDHTCTVDAAGILAIPEGSDGQNFDRAGWGFQAGGGFAVTPPPRLGSGWQWYVTSNYLYDRFKANAHALALAVAANPQLQNATAAHGDFSSVTLDVNPRLEFRGRYSVYAIGGFGWLRRGVNFNGANPGTLLQSSGPSLDRLSSNSGVFDLGVGINTKPRIFHGLMLFGEVRVYRGLAVNNGSTLVPISLGVRW